VSSALDNYAGDTRAMARASGLTPMQEEVCRRVIDGESIKRICEDEGMPSKATVFNWLLRDEAFRVAYAIAAHMRGHHMFEEAIEVASQEPPRIIVQTGEDTLESRVDPGAVQAMRLKTDTLKWAAGKLNPKQYGDKLDVTTGGEPLARDLNENDKAVRLAALAGQILGRRSDA
jgi:hypothetical protein